MKLNKNLITTKGFRADMHNHTDSSKDSKCHIDDLCLAHIEKGTSAFAITDHLNLEALERDSEVCALIYESFKKTTEAREKYADKVEILRGVEVGSAIWHPGVISDMLSKLDFDVVIGSIHTSLTDEIDIPYSWFDFTNASDEAIDKLIKAYFNDVLDTALNTDYDILAHINCPFRYLNGKFGKAVDELKYEEIIREILKAVIKRGKSLELNTSNCTFADSFFMPDNRILSIYRDLGGTMISMGSDAHVAKNCRVAFGEAEELLKSLGFDKLCMYRKRTPYFYSI